VNEILIEIREMVINGNGKELLKLVNEAVAKDLKPKKIIDDGLIAGMDVVGQHMKTGAMFIPEVLHSARNMQAAMEILAPLLAETDRSFSGKVVIGTVEGDLHDIGKNLVALMLKGAGFDVIDLGGDVKPEAFVDAVSRHHPQVVGMSALLTTTMLKMRDTLAALQESGLRSQVKVMAGGAPVTQKLIEDIGADGYGSSAPMAVDLAKKFTLPD
jgi:5-methyltetrahydrofolate--homocysteine methyltransferase